MIWSHPDKPLEKHIEGVLKKYEKNSSLAIGRLVVLFHDLGKFNPNFQKKILGLSVDGYSNHSYLSVIVFYNFLLNNQDVVSNFLNSINKNDLKVKVWQILTIIAHHHGNLPDLTKILSKEETISAGEFANSNPIHISSFITETLKIEHRHFNIGFNEKQLAQISSFDPIRQGVIWQENALQNFTETQFAFACLIEADKRDAGDNEDHQIRKRIYECNDNLNKRLNKKFQEIDKLLIRSPLNNLRTEIRQEAVKNVAKALADGKRVFSLPAPTGAGKTFALLAVAKEILQYDFTLGISYILPFLSITDQVQKIVEELGIECLPISSKSENKVLDDAQRNYENNPNKENIEKLLRQSFSENTFDHPFILTTFVQFFETLVSNRNATLLKLPNFSNRIFLIDEIQALPPRLYIFFAAWLEEFCRQHKSYVIFSTGTMPKFSLPNKVYSAERKLNNPALLFRNYKEDHITEIVKPEKYFGQDVFNRYKIDWIEGEEIDYQNLICHVKNQSQSCLVILNTIKDTKHLYIELKKEFNNVILLNTHFVVKDRQDKIEVIKDCLEKAKQVIVISTQLIEAGVDVDFPVVYRDLCPLPSLIQSAGRCNRNKKIEYGQVYLFILKNQEGKKSSELIYRKEAKDFVKYCRSEIKNGTYERDLFNIQSRFFEKIQKELIIGDFVWYVDKFGNEKTENLVRLINNAAFEKAGRFKLILESQFGETYQYFIPEDENDNRYDNLVSIMLQSFKLKDLKGKIAHKVMIEQALKLVSNRLVTVRIKQSETAPAFSNSEEYFGIRVLSDLSKYSKENGIELGVENNFI